MEEREIDLRLLIYKTLKQWRKALVLGIIAALVLGGYAFLTGSKSDAEFDEAQAEYEESLAEYEEDFAILEQKIKLYQEGLINQQEYNVNSQLMKINPYNKYSVTLRIEANSGASELETARNLQACEDFARGSDMYKYVLERTSIVPEIRYLTELVTVETNYDAASLKIETSGSTQEDAAKLASLIKESIEKGPAGGKCSVVCGSPAASVDNDLKAIQNSNTAYIDTCFEAIDDAKSELEKLTEPVFVYPSGVNVRSAVKKAVIGFVVGVLAVFAWYCVKYVITSKISGDDFWKAVNVPFLGSVFTDMKKENAVDRFVRRLCGYKEDLPFDISAGLVAANIAALNRNQEGSKLALVGDVKREIAETVLAGTGVDFAGDILAESSAVRSLEGYDGVILAVTEDKTGMDQVVHQMGLLKSWGKNVAGAVSVK